MILLALCRASADELSSTSSAPHEGEEAEAEAEEEAGWMARLDKALLDHFNGIIAPGCRFMFSCRHGVTSPSSARNGTDGGVRGRSGRLVIAFSSLGNGLVRHEFGGSLTLVNCERTRRGVRAVDECDDHCHARDEDDNDDGNDGGAHLSVMARFDRAIIACFERPRINKEADVYQYSKDDTPDDLCAALERKREHKREQLKRPPPLQIELSYA